MWTAPTLNRCSRRAKLCKNLTSLNGASRSRETEGSGFLTGGTRRSGSLGGLILWQIGFAYRFWRQSSQNNWCAATVLAREVLNAHSRFDHRHHRPGWLLFGRVPAQERLSRLWYQASLEQFQYGSRRAHPSPLAPAPRRFASPIFRYH